MKDFIRYEKQQWRLSEAPVTPLQYIMVQSTPAAAAAGRCVLA